MITDKVQVECAQCSAKDIVTASSAITEFSHECPACGETSVIMPNWLLAEGIGEEIVLLP